MKRAIISDIHGNFEALSAVLEKIQELGITEIVCLGDIIGYGPDPVRCLDTVIDKCKLTILGNHDQAAVFDPQGFNPVALRAIYWTRDQLEDESGGIARCNRRWDFLGELPRRKDEGKFLFVHGSPRDPTNEYVFPEHIYEPARLENLMKRFEQYCFQGHTHIPGIFTETGNFISPSERDHEYDLTETKVMINVGSVGQPRDEDPRACFAVLDPEAMKLNYYRVEYDVEETRKKIYGVPELDNMLGDRLLSGR